MKTVADCREFAAKCLEMAARMTDRQDREHWSYRLVANAREAAPQRNEPPELMWRTLLSSLR
jgi:hypothetical protein